jgi:hypothetical protein
MAFVHYEMSIIAHEIGYLAFPHQTLNGRNIDETSRPLPPATDDANTSRIHIESSSVYGGTDFEFVVGWALWPR